MIEQYVQETMIDSELFSYKKETAICAAINQFQEKCGIDVWVCIYNQHGDSVSVSSASFMNGTYETRWI